MKKVYLENSTYSSYKKILEDTRKKGYKDLDFFCFPDLEKTSNLKLLIGLISRIGILIETIYLQSSIVD